MDLPASADQGEDEHDFQAPIRLYANSSHKRDHSQVESEDDLDDAIEEVSTCTICQTAWTNAGLHRPFNLKCGHVFGKSCIDSHIRSTIAQFGSAFCPLCKKQVVKSEPRRIWPTKLIPEREEDLKLLQADIEQAKNTLIDLATKNKQVKYEIDDCKRQLQSLVPEQELRRMNNTSMPKPMTVASVEQKLVYQYKIKIAHEMYQAMDLNSQLDMAVLATYKTKSHTFGLRKVNLFDPSLTEFVPVNHQDRIRHIQHSEQSMILSTGDDKTLKLTSMTKNTVVQSYTIGSPCFSCAFDKRTTTALYCGTANGELMVFDVRNTKDSLCQLKKPVGLTSPITSIHTVDDAIVCSDNDSVYSWIPDTSGQYVYHPLPYTSQQGSSEEDKLPKKLLSTSFFDRTMCTAALDSQSHSRLYLCQLLENELDGHINAIDWTCELPIDPFLCSHFKQQDTMYICYTKGNWAYVRTRERDIQEIEFPSPVLDVQHTRIQKDTLTTVLLDQELQVYKFS
ncbi:hypothetical protein BD560DRAFT_410807 [Blakeslea trispora]|nr:hypothetical protein BD560DRAFT_410807 [Blakeslea trispora]